MISSFGTACPIYAVTSNRETYKQMALVWNVIPIYVEDRGMSVEEKIRYGINKVKESGELKDGDTIVLAGGKYYQALPDENVNRMIGGVITV